MRSGGSKKGKKEHNSSKVKGIGMAILMQGSGIPRVDMGAATIKLNEDGSFNVLYGGTDIGTGLDTVVAQIVAETLGVKPEQVIVYAADTDMTPFDKGAYASSGTFISGGAVYNAALKIREMLLEEAKEIFGELDSKDYILEGGKIISPKTNKSVTLSEIAYNSFYVKNTGR